MKAPPEDFPACVPNVGVRLEKPLIAAVSGWTVGGGLVMVEMADLCVAADTPRLPDGELSASARFELDAGIAGWAELAVHNGWLDSLTMGTDAGAWPDKPRLRGITAGS